LTPGYLLQLLPRHQLLLKIQTFKKSDSFSVDDKKGEERFYGVILGVFILVFIYVLFLFLDMYYMVDMFYLCTFSIW